MNVSSSMALLVYTGAMVGLAVFTSFRTATPFLAFSTQLTIAFVAYVTKRLMQKKETYNDKG